MRTFRRTLRPSLLFCALLAAAPTFAEDAKDAKDAPEPNGSTPIATVNGTDYSLDLFRVFYFEMLQQNQGQKPEAVQEKAFDDFMSLIVAAQEARRRNLDTLPQVTTAIELQRMRVLANAALADMAKGIQPTEDELKAAYERVKATAGRTEYKARHILVAEEDEAKKLIKELGKKADFAELAKAHSIGPKDKNNGELGWFDATRMPAPIVEAVAAMEVGSYSKQPVHTQFGWHILQLQDKREVPPPAYEDIKPQLTAAVQRQKLAEKVGELRNAAMVDLNEEIVKITAPADAKDGEKGKDAKP